MTIKKENNLIEKFPEQLQKNKYLNKKKTH